MKITRENYHSPEVSRAYLSCSQIKAWAECEAAAQARYDLGENRDEPTEAMLLGSYLDEILLSGDVQSFEDANREKLFTNRGTLRAGFARINDMVARCKADPRFMAMIEGEHQVILQGVIGGHPTRIMIDALPSAMKCITDLKKMAQVDRLQWSEKERAKVEFWKTYRYDWQSSIYREVARQNGLDLPFILAVCEAEPPHQLFGQPIAIDCLHEVEDVVQRISEVRLGREPVRCGTCKWCKTNSKFEIREPAYI